MRRVEKLKIIEVLASEGNLDVDTLMPIIQEIVSLVISSIIDEESKCEEICKIVEELSKIASKSPQLKDVAVQLKDLFY